MFKILVKEEISKHCIDQVERFNFGNRGIADGNKREQLTGIIGESVLKDLFDLDLVDGKEGNDNGEDIKFKNLSIDVKTMGRTTDVRGYYVNNFIGLQKEFPTDVYIFNSLNINKNELTIVGIISKKRLLQKAKFYKKGTLRHRSNGTSFRTKADLYEIENNQLSDIKDLNDLVNKIEILNSHLYG